MAAEATPQISVVVPCYNAARIVGVQLEALARQVDAPEFEVVLVDNRSTDDLAAAASEFAGRLDVRVVRADDLANPGYARNVGVAHSRADKLAFCDADDHVGRTWVRDAAAALEVTEVVNGGAQPVAAADFDRGPEHLDALIGQPRDVVQVRVPSAPEPYPILLGGSCAMRREVYVGVGGYDVAVRYGVEDNDLALRLQRAGYRLGRSSGMALAYRTRPESEQPLSRSFRAGELHLLLAHRHGLFGRSPNLGRGWWLGLARCGVAAGKMALRPDDRDWRGLARRAALQAGMLVGQVRYGVAGRLPEPRPGVGL
ncbi:glycosyltransferase [Propionibacteriaceae bacterium G57]|uniref:glycosyltransferase n=1 Tax=Aestuariimicrobium sp. G57 TaxID=3418485 RepID=UPI003DA737E9